MMVQEPGALSPLSWRSQSCRLGQVCMDSRMGQVSGAGTFRELPKGTLPILVLPAYFLCSGSSRTPGRETSIHRLGAAEGNNNCQFLSALPSHLQRRSCTSDPTMKWFIFEDERQRGGNFIGIGRRRGGGGLVAENTSLHHTLTMPRHTPVAS